MKMKAKSSKVKGMGGVKIGVAIAIALTCASTLSGCKLLGQGKKEAKAVEGSEVSGQGAAGAGENLNLRLVLADPTDPDLPNLSADLKAARKPNSDENIVLSQDDEIDFPTPIALPNERHPKSRFLVWGEEWRGGRIHSASLDQRIEEEDGKLVGPTERIPVHYDAASRRWFFPLTALVRGAPGEENPGKQHRLTLDLSLDNGQRVLVRVRLRFRSQRVALLHEVLGQQSKWHFASSVEGARAGGSEGAAIGSTVVTNPIGRPIRAWLRSNVVVSMNTFVRHDFYRNYHFNAHLPYDWNIPALPPVSVQEWFSSSARLGISPVRVERGGGVLAEPERSSSGWISVRLAAHESVAVRWHAQVLTGSHCVVPAMERQRFEYSNGKVLPSLSNLPPYSARSEYATSTERNSAWTVVGHAFEGTGSILTAASETSEGIEVLDSEESPPPQAQVLQIQDRSGIVPTGAAPYSCQGWF